ncbi:MAG: hypothetical protein ACE5H9_06845 [Anaerolineae bacterium]
MPAYTHQQRLMFGLGLLLLIAVLLAGLGLTLLLIRERRVAYYPGALQVSDHSLYTGSQSFHYRRDTSYRTPDDFVTVYQWYSAKFDLRDVVSAQGGCTLIEGTKRWLVLERHMSAMVCSTPVDQMVFVERSLSLQFR